MHCGGIGGNREGVIRLVCPHGVIYQEVHVVYLIRVWHAEYIHTYMACRVLDVCHGIVCCHANCMESCIFSLSDLFDLETPFLLTGLLI